MVDHEVIRHTAGTAVKTKTITKDSEVKAEIVISFLKRNLDFSSGEAETEDRFIKNQGKGTRLTGYFEVCKQQSLCAN